MKDVELIKKPSESADSTNPSNQFADEWFEGIVNTSRGQHDSNVAAMSPMAEQSLSKELVFYTNSLYSTNVVDAVEKRVSTANDKIAAAPHTIHRSGGKDEVEKREREGFLQNLNLPKDASESRLRKAVDDLLKRLDSDEYQVRKDAFKTLQRGGMLVLQPIAEALAKSDGAELQKSLARLLSPLLLGHFVEADEKIERLNQSGERPVPGTEREEIKAILKILEDRKRNMAESLVITKIEKILEACNDSSPKGARLMSSLLNDIKEKREARRATVHCLQSKLLQNDEFLVEL